MTDVKAASKELDARCRILAGNISESLHIVVHDPSLALYRLQEHVKKSLPVLVEKKCQVVQVNNNLQGACFDLENDIEALQSMASTSATFTRINELLRSAMYYRQQIDHERMRSEGRSRVPRLESTDSIAQELKKSKSLGHLRSAGGSSSSGIGNNNNDNPESGSNSSSLSERRSSTSMQQVSSGRNKQTSGASAPTSPKHLPDEVSKSGGSSTATSGADSDDADSEATGGDAAGEGGLSAIS